MNMRIKILWMLLFSIALATLCFGQQQPYVAQKNEEIYGTWIGISKQTPVQKVVINQDGIFYYYNIPDKTPMSAGKLTLTAKWTDAEGNIWYKTFTTYTSGTLNGYNLEQLYKLSKAGSVMEYDGSIVDDFSSDSFPTELNIKGAWYGAFNRSR
jgi:hypothetical protein